MSDTSAARLPPRCRRTARCGSGSRRQGAGRRTAGAPPRSSRWAPGGNGARARDGSPPTPRAAPAEAPWRCRRPVKVHVSVDPAASVEEQDGCRATPRALWRPLARERSMSSGVNTPQGHLVARRAWGRASPRCGSAGWGRRASPARPRPHAAPVGRFDVGLEPRGRLERGEHRFVEGHGGPPFRKGAAGRARVPCGGSGAPPLG